MELKLNTKTKSDKCKLLYELLEKNYSPYFIHNPDKTTFTFNMFYKQKNFDWELFDEFIKDILPYEMNQSKAETINRITNIKDILPYEMNQSKAETINRITNIRGWFDSAEAPIYLSTHHAFNVFRSDKYKDMDAPYASAKKHLEEFEKKFGLTDLNASWLEYQGLITSAWKNFETVRSIIFSDTQNKLNRAAETDSLEKVWTSLEALYKKGDQAYWERVKNANEFEWLANTECPEIVESTILKILLIQSQEKIKACKKRNEKETCLNELFDLYQNIVSKMLKCDKESLDAKLHEIKIQPDIMRQELDGKITDAQKKIDTIKLIETRDESTRQSSLQAQEIKNDAQRDKDLYKDDITYAFEFFGIITYPLNEEDKAYLQKKSLILTLKSMCPLTVWGHAMEEFKKILRSMAI